MGLLRRFEGQLEKIFEGSFTKAFKSGVQPLEIARKLMRTVDDERVMGIGETLAPNFYNVSLSPVDYDRLSGYLDRLGSEMESLIITYANEKDYHLLTRPRISFMSHLELQEGEFSVMASLDETTGAQPPTERVNVDPQQLGEEVRLGVLTILKGDKAGYTFNLDREKTRIGRSEENDLVLADRRASRFHAEIDRRSEGYVIRDLGSTNGTMVRGRQIQERLLEDGDTVAMGETEMRFGLITNTRQR
jgi:hypothetical protein